MSPEGTSPEEKSPEGMSPEGTSPEEKSPEGMSPEEKSLNYGLPPFGLRTNSLRTSDYLPLDFRLIPSGLRTTTHK